MNSFMGRAFSTGRAALVNVGLLGLASRPRMPTPKLGVLINEEKALPPPARRTLWRWSCCGRRSSTRRAPRRRGRWQRVRAVHPQAALVPYVWHLVSHGAEDGVRELGTRALPGEARQFGHLQDTPEVREAWQTTLRCAQEFAAKQVVLRTPASFTPGGVGHARLTAFAAARAAEGIEVVWEAEGLWEPAQTLSLARKLGLQTIVPAFDGDGAAVHGDARAAVAAGRRRGADLRLRGVLAETLAFALEGAEAVGEDGPMVLFAGPRAYANLRSFARELALVDPADDAALRD
jgi:hypothetical protein